MKTRLNGGSQESHRVGRIQFIGTFIEGSGSNMVVLPNGAPWYSTITRKNFTCPENMDTEAYAKARREGRLVKLTTPEIRRINKFLA